MLDSANNKKKIVLAAAVLAAAILAAGIPPATAHAANPVAEVIKSVGDYIGGLALNVVLIPLSAIIYGIGFIGSTLVWIAAWVISFGVELNTNILAANNAALHVGWGVSRDLANLGFVLAIIFIAFLTILRSAGYDTRQMLWRLIVAALLVNFSLVIAGAILDFAGVINGFFLSKISDAGGIGLSHQIAAGFAPQGFLETAQGTAENLSLSRFPGQLNLLIGVSFATLLTFIVALTLLTLAAMFLARFIVLTLLLAVAPIAWLLWIWPGLDQHWKKWWEEFMRWTFFMPAATFFLYLTLTVALNRGKYLGTLADTVKTGAAPENVTIFADLAAKFGQTAAVIGLAIGGLLLSYKVGGFAASAASMTGGWVAAKTQEFGKRRAIGAKNRALTFGAKTDEKGQTTTAIQRGAGLIARVPGLRGVSSAISNAVAGARDPKAVADYQTSRLSNLTNTGLLNVATSPTTRAALNPVLTAAVAAEVAKRNLTSDPRIQPLMDEFLRATQTMGNLADVLANRPELATPALSGGANITEAVQKAMGKIKPSQAENISDASLTVSTVADTQRHVVLNLTNGHVSRIASEGSAKQRAALSGSLDFLKTNLAALSPDETKKLVRIQDFLKNNPQLQL